MDTVLELTEERMVVVSNRSIVLKKTPLGLASVTQSSRTRNADELMRPVQRPSLA